MRTITRCEARDDWTLHLVFEDGQRRVYDVKPLLDCEAFAELKDLSLFLSIHNRGYFVEWPNGADLSADTLCLEGYAA
jgi:hypothetical protein